jgi:hypothetical protein
MAERIEAKSAKRSFASKINVLYILTRSFAFNSSSWKSSFSLAAASFYQPLFLPDL